jgi:hypothetical protein
MQRVSTDRRDFMKAAGVLAMTAAVRRGQQTRRWYEPEISDADKGEFQGLLDRSLALMQQIGLGFEYYGRPPEFVPSLSIDFYTVYIDRLFALLQPLEDDYANYSDALKQQKKADQFVLNTLARNALLIDQRRAEQEDVIKRQTSIGEYLKIISYDVEEVRQRVVLAATRFESEIRNAAGGQDCGIKEILTALGCIVGIAGAAKDIIHNLLDGFDVLKRTIGQRLEGILNNLVQVREFARQAGTNIEKLRTDYAGFRQILDKNPDAVKIIVSDDVEQDLQRDQLDKILNNYPDMPEAIELRKQMTIFRALIAAKNRALLEYASAIVDYFRLQAEIEQIGLESARVQKKFTEAFDPTIPAVQAYMRKAYSDSKEFLARAIFDMNKAFEYWTCNNSDIPLDVGQLSELRATYGALNVRVTDALARIGPGQQDESSLTFSLRKLSGDRELARFRKVGVANFAINLDQREFAHRYNVFLREARVFVKGAKTADHLLTVAMLHSGVAQRIGLNGHRRTFRHEPQVRLFKYDLQSSAIKSHATFGGYDPKNFMPFHLRHPGGLSPTGH